MLIHGKNLDISFPINGILSVAAHATNVVLDLTADTQETTTKNGLKGKTNDYQGKYQYTLSLDGITNFIDRANISNFQDCILNGVKLPFVFTDNNEIEWTGTILVTNVNVSSQFDALSLFKSTLLGDGDLVKVQTNPLPPIGLSVEIIDQFGDLIANVAAPGIYSVLRFDTIDLHSFDPTTDTEITPPLIIMQAS